MSSGRMHERGAIHLVTNRTEEGRFLMKPTDAVVEIIQYWFARALTLHGSGIEVYAFVFMSNHFHILLRDTRGQLAQFMGYFQSNAAREINELLDRKGAHFWARHYHDEIIEGPRTLWSKFLYVLCNPVKSGLVMRAVQWGGWSAARMALRGEGFSITRLDRTRYHNASRGKQKPAKSDFEGTYGFELTPLPMLAQLEGNKRCEETRKVLASAERHYRGRWKSHRPLGMQAVMEQRWSTRAAEPEPRPRRRFACDDPARERELLETYRRFIGAYKEVFSGFRRSARLRRAFHGEWPAGSYPPGCWQPVQAA